MMDHINISGKIIGNDMPCFIIAEAGVNHNGQLDLALKLVDVAASCGADAVKFQTFKAEQVVTEKGGMANYQKKNLKVTESQREMLRKLELPENFYLKIIAKCKEKNIIFLSTPHGGKESVVFLESLNIPAYKIGSGDLTNYILLEKIAKIGKPVIISTGMATLKEVKNAVLFIKSFGNKEIIVLHATTDYPCLPDEINLKVMATMRSHIKTLVGYSDHTIGNQAAIMAVTLGASVYECHFTLDKNLPGPDQIASADPQELKEKIKAIRNVEIIMGSSIKKPSFNEKKLIIKTIRKSIVAFNNLPKGHVIKSEDLEAKRPSTGVSPEKYMHFFGKTLKHFVKKDDQLHFDDVEKK